MLTNKLISLGSRASLFSSRKWCSFSTTAQFRDKTRSASQTPLPGRARVVVCGGGITGSSVLYHLTANGWSDIVLLEPRDFHNVFGEAGVGAVGGSRAGDEQKPRALTHQAHMVVGHALSTNSLEDRLSSYSRQLCMRLLDDPAVNSYASNGLSVERIGSLLLASNLDRLHSLQRKHARLRALGVRCELLTPAQVAKLAPYLRSDEDLVGALHLPDDCVVRQPLLFTRLLTELALDKGAHVRRNCVIEKVTYANGEVNSVVTDAGTIQCDYFVNSAGFMSNYIGHKSEPPIELPLMPTQTNVLFTQPIPELSGLPFPMLFDLDNRLICCTTNEGALVVSGYEREGRTRDPNELINEAPSVFSMRADDDWLHFQPILHKLLRRLPLAARATPRTLVKNLESFSADGRPVVGQILGVRNYLIGAALEMASLSLAPGIGRVLSSMITTGSKPLGIWPHDVQRFVPALHCNVRLLEERCRESPSYRIALDYPLLSQVPKLARELRTGPLYMRLKAAGGVFGVSSNGFERPLYFETGEPPEKMAHTQTSLSSAAAGGTIVARDPSLYPAAARAFPHMTFMKPDWLDNVVREYTAAKEAVCLIDLSFFSKITVGSKRPEAALNFLQRVCANDLDQPVGSVMHTAMLNERGRYENDCSVARTAPGQFIIISSPSQETRCMDWLWRQKRVLDPEDAVRLRNVTAELLALDVVGPLAESLLRAVSDIPADQKDAMKPMSCRYIAVGRVRGVLAMRLTHTGEDGFMLYVRNEHALHVYSRLAEMAVHSSGCVDAGWLAYLALRSEKFLLQWGRDLDSSVTPFEIGRDFRVKFEEPADANSRRPTKGDFIGRSELLRIKEANTQLTRRCVHFILREHDTERDPFPHGDEPIYRDGKFVGFTMNPHFSPQLNAFSCTGYVSNYDGESGSADLMAPPLSPLGGEYFRGHRFEVDIGGRRFPMTASLYAPRFRPFEIVPLADTSLRIH